MSKDKHSDIQHISYGELLVEIGAKLTRLRDGFEGGLPCSCCQPFLDVFDPEGHCFCYCALGLCWVLDRARLSCHQSDHTAVRGVHWQFLRCAVRGLEIPELLLGIFKHLHLHNMFVSNLGCIAGHIFVDCS